MTYCRVNPVLWDDDKFIELDDLTGKVWFLLMTGNQVTALPGLQRGGVASIAETVRRPFDLVAESLTKLCSLGMISIDARKRVICLHKSPKHNPAESPNHLRAWWIRWNEIPDCDLKFRHLAVLKQHANLHRPEHRRVWEQTFATVELSSASTVDQAISTVELAASTSTISTSFSPTMDQLWISPEPAPSQPLTRAAEDPKKPVSVSATATVTGRGDAHAHDPSAPAPCTYTVLPVPCTVSALPEPCMDTVHRAPEHQPPPQDANFSYPEKTNPPEQLAEQPSEKTAPSATAHQTPSWLAPRTPVQSQGSVEPSGSTDGPVLSQQPGVSPEPETFDLEDTGIRRIPEAFRQPIPSMPKVHCPSVEYNSDFHPEEALHLLREASRDSTRGPLGRLCSAQQMEELGKVSRSAYPSALTLEDFRTLGSAWKAGAALRWMKHAPDMGMLLRNGGEHLLSGMLDAFEWRESQKRPGKAPPKSIHPACSSGPQQIAIIDLPPEQRKAMASQWMDRFKEACGRSKNKIAG